MTTARRTLLTAAIAGVLLGALWFVPTVKANAAATSAASHGAPITPGDQGTSGVRGPAPAAYSDGTGELPETGAFNTKPYLIGGAVFLVLGAGIVAYSLYRGREELYEGPEEES
ncbi:LPXTG cell wall anchor domain-containing protein [Streptomyces sp. NPDC050560]|uniref:LPXTG cell wall anchor domain-containing protein n=1 Tax=Streptomyces sp. NPDC050560 TaxID=3365630 RepID=UPI0037A258FE